MKYLRHFLAHILSLQRLKHQGPRWNNNYDQQFSIDIVFTFYFKKQFRLNKA